MLKEEILAIYNRILKQAKETQEPEPEKTALQGTRTEVHEALQSKGAPPEPHEDDEGDADAHHLRQKRHFTNLWKQTDRLVDAALK